MTEKNDREKGGIFKAACFAACNLAKMPAQAFAALFAGKLHYQNGEEIGEETLIAGYNYAENARQDGTLSGLPED